MRLLLCLAADGGEIVSVEALLDAVWAGVAVSPDSVYQAVASLRRQLGDDPRQPTYIATVPRLGYRMVAPVAYLDDEAADSNRQTSGRTASGATEREYRAASIARRSSRLAWLGVMALTVAVAIVLALAFRGRVEENKSSSSASALAALSRKSIAVLPFLDLTDGMKEEEFADGMTEELIDKFSKIPGLRVPAPTASFYYKGKQVPIAEIAKSLGVVYVLDGSVRKSGARLRVAARLVRAESGYVMWAETYDRPFGDKLMIQDEIAREVTQALRASLEPEGSR